MYLLYSVALTILFVTLLPYFLYKGFKSGKYFGSLRQRLGSLPQSVRGDGRATIWVHAVSVGEFLAARPLIDRLKRKAPGSRILLSTTTLTGHSLAKSQSLVPDEVFYFPFDWKFAVRRALAWVKPSAVIILETELWPNFLRECRERGVVAILANGRISPRSFRRYERGRPFFRHVVGNFSLMVMQSEADAERARTLGARPSCVRVCGNLKYDLLWDESRDRGVGEEPTRQSSKLQPPTSDARQELDRTLDLSSSQHLIVAGSTAPGEEEILIASLAGVRRHQGLEDARLLLAPRHPERFDEVARLLERSSFKFVRRSQTMVSYTQHARATVTERLLDTQFAADDAANRRPAEIILLDTIGELASMYRFAAVVFVGGSLVPRGGHNILEPAAFAKPIIVGPYTENFRQIVSDFARTEAVVQIGAGNDAGRMLTHELIRLLIEPERANAIGMRARDILLANRGATDCTIAAIKEVMRIEDLETAVYTQRPPTVSTVHFWINL